MADNKKALSKKQQLKEEKKLLSQQKKEQKRQAKEQKKAQKTKTPKLTREEKRQQRKLAQQKHLDEVFESLSPQEQTEVRLESIARLQKNNKKWYKLDNAALMYPMIAGNESPAVFRMAVQLNEQVDPITLQYAVNDICQRFPTICGTLVWGWFWPYIDKPQQPILVRLQTKTPSRPIKLDAKRSQIRVNYFANQIAVEFFHSATDGTGGLLFLNSLVRCYLLRKGVQCDRTNCYDHRDIPAIEEMRDNFANVAVRKNPPPVPPVVKCKQIKGTALKNNKFFNVRGVCSASQLKAVAREHNATVTEFLGAVQLLALDALAKATNCKDEKPIRTLIPVNLRKLYNVETVRNFSSYIFYQYNGQTNVGDVIADIKEQIKQQFCDEYFRGMVSFNYNSGNLAILKPIPAAIKKMVLSAIIKGRGEGTVNCSTLSNVGVVQAPKEFANHVVRYEFALGRPNGYTNCFAVATYNDNCVITITTKYAEKDCERYFFTKLAELGIDVAVERDVWEEEQ